MTPKGAKLSPNSEDDQELLGAIQSGTIPRNHTALKISKLRTPLGRAISQYSTRSVNDLLNNYRKRTSSGMVLSLALKSGIYRGNP